MDTCVISLEFLEINLKLVQRKSGSVTNQSLSEGPWKTGHTVVKLLLSLTWAVSDIAEFTQKNPRVTPVPFFFRLMHTLSRGSFN
ncbi:hypothetical protein GDO81_013273 [Engystomops pustulosus]|uniref:Uncharacterized protein n=1 Tax=Engystomops pustulosus TaxID=76066 RepID=A0AAV7AZ46_ENGPU|nr:hypothetical protein GDO81_013273 [Engystomops pustulosus]